MKHPCPICKVDVEEDQLDWHVQIETKLLLGQSVSPEELAATGKHVVPAKRRSLRAAAQRKNQKDLHAKPPNAQKPPTPTSEPLKQIKSALDAIHRNRRLRGYKLIGQRRDSPIRHRPKPNPIVNTRSLVQDEDATEDENDDSFVICPICKQSVGSSLMNSHLDMCLIDNEDISDHPTNQLVRPQPNELMTPLPSPPLRRLSPRTSPHESHNDTENEIDIGCNCTIYGDVQFTELDVLPYTVALHGPTQLDLAVHSIISQPNNSDLDPMHVKQDLIKKADLAAEQVRYTAPSVFSSQKSGDISSGAQSLVTHALKERITYLEQLTAETPRCKVCWDPLGAEPHFPVVLTDALNFNTSHPLYHTAVTLVVQIVKVLPIIDHRLDATTHSKDPISFEQQLSDFIAQLWIFGVNLIMNKSTFHASLVILYSLTAHNHAQFNPECKHLLLNALTFLNPIRPHLDVSLIESKATQFPYQTSKLTSLNGGSIIGLTPELIFDHLVLLIVYIRDKFDWHELQPDSLLIAPSLLVDQLTECALTNQDPDALLYLLSFDVHVQNRVLFLLSSHSTTISKRTNPSSTTPMIDPPPLWMHPKITAWLCGIAIGQFSASESGNNKKTPHTLIASAHEQLYRRACQLILTTISNSDAPFRYKLAVVDTAIRANIPSKILIKLLEYIASVSTSFQDHGSTHTPATLFVLISSLHHSDTAVRRVGIRLLLNTLNRPLDRTDKDRLMQAFPNPSQSTFFTVHKNETDWTSMTNFTARLHELLNSWSETVHDHEQLGILAFLANHPPYLSTMVPYLDKFVDGFLQAEDPIAQSHLLTVLVLMSGMDPNLRAQIVSRELLNHLVTVIITPSSAILRLRTLAADMTRPLPLPLDKDVLCGSYDPKSWDSVLRPNTYNLISRWCKQYLSPPDHVPGHNARSHQDIANAVHKLRILTVHPKTHPCALKAIREGILARVLCTVPAGDDDAECQTLVWQWIQHLSQPAIRQNADWFVSAAAESILPYLVTKSSTRPHAQSYMKGKYVSLEPSISDDVLEELLTTALQVLQQCQFTWAQIVDKPHCDLLSSCAPFVPTIAITLLSKSMHSLILNVPCTFDPPTPTWSVSACVRLLSKAPEPGGHKAMHHAARIILASDFVIDGVHANIEAWCDPQTSSSSVACVSLFWVPRLCTLAPNPGWLIAAHLAQTSFFVPALREAFVTPADPVSESIRVIELIVRQHLGTPLSKSPNTCQLNSMTEIQSTAQTMLSTDDHEFAWLFLDVALAWQPVPVSARFTHWTGATGFEYAACVGLESRDWRVRAAILKILARICAVNKDQVISMRELVHAALMTAAPAENSIPNQFPADALSHMLNDAAYVAETAVTSQDVGDWLVFNELDLVVQLMAHGLDPQTGTVSLPIIRLTCQTFCKIHADARVHHATVNEFQHVLAPLYPVCLNWIPSLYGIVACQETMLAGVQITAFVFHTIVLFNSEPDLADEETIPKLVLELARIVADKNTFDHINVTKLIRHTVSLILRIVPNLDPNPALQLLIHMDSDSNVSDPSCDLPPSNHIRLAQTLSNHLKLTDKNAKKYRKFILHDPQIIGWLKAAMITDSPNSEMVLDFLPLVVSTNRDAQTVGASLSDIALKVLLKNDSTHKPAVRVLTHLLKFPSIRKHLGTARPGISSPILTMIGIVEQKLGYSPLVKSENILSSTMEMLESYLQVLVFWTYYVESQRQLTSAIPILIDCAAAQTRTKPTHQIQMLSLCILRNACFLRENKAQMSKSDCIERLVFQAAPCIGTSENGPKLRLVAYTAAWLQLVWVLAHTNHRPEVIALRPKLLKQVQFVHNACASTGPCNTMHTLKDPDLLTGHVSINQVFKLAEVTLQTLTLLT